MREIGPGNNVGRAPGLGEPRRELSRLPIEKRQKLRFEGVIAKGLLGEMNEIENRRPAPLFARTLPIARMVNSPGLRHFSAPVLRNEARNP